VSATPPPVARSASAPSDGSESSPDQLSAIVEPVLTARGVKLVDLEHASSLVRVTVDRPGGVDLDTLAALTRAVSAALDERDPIPHRYTLELSSPGLERRLRHATHFRGAVGERVVVRTTPGTPGERRVEGVLVDADDVGIRVDGPDGERHLEYHEIERARTRFDWGPAPRPHGPKRK
jgi:ribosome maturation factor RimP